MVNEGKLEEARAACAQQADEATALLEGTPKFAAEYFSLWEQQRKAPVLLPSGAHTCLTAAALGAAGWLAATEASRPVESLAVCWVWPAMTLLRPP